MSGPPQESPFADLREALRRAEQERSGPNEENQPFVRVDANRARRAGIPEVVFAGNKASAEIADALRRLVEANGRALASRVRPDDARVIQDALQPTISVESHPMARALVAFQPESRPAERR